MDPLHCLLALAITSTAFATQAAERLYACGDDQVREYQVQATAATEIWRWSAAGTKDLPASYRDKLLAHIDECKPVSGGREILVTSSTGGVVLLDRASGKVLFRAQAPMAHSAELLPNGLIAVALSIDPKGDRLQLYDRNRNETPLFEVPLPSGHGVVWDNAQSRLLALSHDLLQSFVVTGDRTAPSLKELERWTLPGRRDGHDLSSLGDGRYWVTTDDGVWLFNPQNGAFSPFEPLRSSSRIKAVSVLGERMAWVEVEENWWAYGFHLANRDGSAAVRFPVNDMHLYKVRWIR
ncbi:DUF6528 family protein [Pseudomonas rhodesiae]|uniref:DUF6528 family protein n=1 Tax=Pseudomonas rhodesiae TaxID=76760 RepID=UPI000F468E38|nr:DUF6528 family protein [Pseudomonas rhodesiae]ROM50833.1 hypothetical protein BK650_19555 [Pseudomonas rhodesiae]ROM61405.1 hypothetical protein BK651_23295 [Pseudomonas rhodesiae]